MSQEGLGSLKKGATYADAFSGIVSDAKTLTDSNAAGERIVAGLSLASELLPVSVSDVKDVYRAAKKVVGGADEAGDAAQSVKRKRRFSQADREKGFEKSKDAEGTPRCEYCGTELDPNAGKPNSYEADHSEAFSNGGESTQENLAPSCRTCNRSKGAKPLDDWTPPNTDE